MDIKAYISSGIIESYVLGLASEEEVSILNCIRQNNTEVEQAIAEAYELMETLAHAQAVPAPPLLKESIWDKLAAIEDTQEKESISLPVENKPQADPVRPIAKRNNVNWAIAASVLLTASVAANVILYKSSQKEKAELKQVVGESAIRQESLAGLEEKWRLLLDPQIKAVKLAGAEDKSEFKAMVFWNQKTSAVYLSLENMPEAPRGKQYQLWAMEDGTPVDAGVFPLNADYIDVSTMAKISKAQAFAITLEDEGGSAVPTLSELYVIGNI